MCISSDQEWYAVLSAARGRSRADKIGAWMTGGAVSVPLTGQHLGKMITRSGTTQMDCQLELNLQSCQRGFDVEVENRRGTRGRLRGGRSQLGLCSAEPGAWVLR